MITHTKLIRRIMLRASAAAIVLGGAAAAQGQCPRITFEELGFTPNVVVNNQYNASTPLNNYGSGVRFSAFSPGCSGIQAVTSSVTGASSQPMVLTTSWTCANGCLCIEFNTPQAYVTFDVSTLGVPTQGTVTITAYGTPCGTPGAPVFASQTVTIPAPLGGTDHIFRPVTVRDPVGDIGACPIKRIEICAEGIEKWPAIDNLEWGGGSKPTVQISSPLYLQCFCPTDTIVIRGKGCKGLFDCEYSEVLEYSPIGAPNVWTQIATRNSSQCAANSLLYSFSASILPTNQSIFYLRVTGSNVCKGSDNDVTMVKIDRNPPAVAINCPPPGSFISTRCDPLFIAASVTDDCQASWNLSLTPPGGPTSLLTSGNAVGSNGSTAASAISLPWSPTTPDGSYTLQLNATDQCGRSSATSTTFTLDNTPPLAVIATPPVCDWLCPGFTYTITGKAYDLNVKTWRLEWYKVGSGWQTISTGSTNVGSPTSNGVLGSFAVPANSPRCCSMLRLTVEDKTNPRVCGLPSGGNPKCNTTVYEHPVAIGIPCDFNGDGLTTVQDIFDLLSCYFSPPCP